MLASRQVSLKLDGLMDDNCVWIPFNHRHVCLMNPETVVTGTHGRVYIASFLLKFSHICKCKHMLVVRICPVSTVSELLTVSKWWTILMLNRKVLEMQRTKTSTHTLWIVELLPHTVNISYPQVIQIRDKYW